MMISKWLLYSNSNRKTSTSLVCIFWLFCCTNSVHLVSTGVRCCILILTNLAQTIDECIHPLLICIISNGMCVIGNINKQPIYWCPLCICFDHEQHNHPLPVCPFVRSVCPLVHGQNSDNLEGNSVYVRKFYVLMQLLQLFLVFGMLLEFFEFFIIIKNDAPDCTFFGSFVSKCCVTIYFNVNL